MTRLDAYLRDPIAALRRHPAMSSSNVFRRKQNEILGLDNSSFISSPDEIANVVARFQDLDTGKSHSYLILSADPAIASVKGNQKKVRVISPHPSQVEVEEDTDDGDRSIASRLGGSRDYAKSLYDQHSPPMETDNPLSEVSDEDSYDDEFDDEVGPMRKSRRLVPFKANQALNVDYDNPWRNSTAIGNQPGIPRDGEAVGISAKAQKLLGMSQPGKAANEDAYRREHSLSPETDNVAPKALRTLGIPSNPFKRPSTADERTLLGEEPERSSALRGSSTQFRPYDPDDFKRLFSSGHRHPQLDNSSSTDVSTLSRSSVLSSLDRRTDTPRSSHEISPEDIRAYGRHQFRHPVSSVFSKISRTDSMVDPAAVLTEPFSPLSSMPPESPDEFQHPPYPSDTFELPAHIPMSHFAPDKTQFIAELPAAEPTIAAELPSVPLDVFELPGAEMADSPASTIGSLKSPPIRGRSTRGMSVDHPSIPELSSFSASPPKSNVDQRPRTAGGLSHAKTFPSLQQLPQQISQRNSSLPRQDTGSTITAQSSMPPPPPRNPSTLPLLTTNLPQSNSQISNLSQGLSNNESITKRPSTPPVSTTSPTSPSSIHSGGLGMIAKAAVGGARRQGSQASLAGSFNRRELVPETSSLVREVDPWKSTNILTAEPKAETRFEEKEMVNQPSADTDLANQVSFGGADSKRVSENNYDAEMKRAGFI
jgi:hypothetical protein